MNRTDRRSYGGILLRAVWGVARLLILVVLVLSITFLLFALLPADPIRSAVGVNADAETVARLRSELGYDAPLGVRLLRHLRDAGRLDLGRSLVTRRPVAPVVLQAYGATLSYVATALTLSAAGSLGLIMVGQFAGPRVRAATLLVIRLGTAVPSLVTSMASGIVLLWLTGALGLGATDARGVLLASAALAVFPTCSLAEIGLLESFAVERRSYVTAARSFGFRRTYVLLRYVIPSALAPWLAQMSNIAASLVAGSVVIEIVFSLPGFGSLLLQSVLRNDYPMTQGVVIMSVVSFLVLNGLAGAVLRQRRWLSWR